MINPIKKEQVVRGRVKQIGSVFLGFLLLFILVSKISLSELVQTLGNANIVLLIPAFVLNLLMLGMMAYRWQILYRISEKSDRPSFKQVLAASFVGVFFNNFLPSTIGGDAYRTLRMSHFFPEQGLSRSLTIVYVDRLVGLLGMILIGLTALLVKPDLPTLPQYYVFAVVTIFIIISLWLVLSISSRFQTLILTVLGAFFDCRKNSMIGKLEIFFTHLSLYGSRWGLLGRALLLSILLRLVWFYGCYLVGLSLQLKLPLTAFLVSLPIVELIRMVPITFQGLGIREGLFVLFFNYYGVSPSDAVLLAAIVYILLNMNGIAGGGVYLVQKMKVRG